MTAIVVGWPPNIKKIRAVLPVSERNIFAWDGVIYNPGGGDLSSELIKHEEVHFVQQGGKPKKWWKKFLADEEFRLAQELPAHQAEYREFCRKYRDRNLRAQFLNALGRKLAAPMYGSLITAGAAMKAIKNG